MEYQKTGAVGGGHATDEAVRGIQLHDGYNQHEH